MTAVRDAVMLPGRCSACKTPAERHAGSGRWWHVGDICEWRSVTAFRPVEIYPLEGGGHSSPGGRVTPTGHITTEEAR